MWIPGPRLTQVFASRWKALFWAVSILVSAYCFVPRQGEEKDEAQAMSLAQQVLPGNAAQAATTQASPWAADSSAP